MSNARSLGYEGIEFAQDVRTLDRPEKLMDSLARNRVSIVGLAGGPMRERVEFAEALPICYLYTDEWDEDAITLAIERGFRVGIHPHRYKAIETVSHAASYLSRFGELGLILDTAHLYLAGDNIIRALEQYSERVLAVHLKDWTSRYGRSPYRFARGFTTLGEGNLGEVLESTISWVTKFDYSGWLIVEQDTPNGSPIECAQRSRHWLSARGI